MKRVYANLLGVWTDITDNGTLADHQDPLEYLENALVYDRKTQIAKCFEYDYINVQYDHKNYRIHPSCIQIVTQKS